MSSFVAMPNRVHGIVGIVGADPRVRPVANPCSTNAERDNGLPDCDETTLGAHAGAPLRGVSLGAIIQWFKTMTNND